MDKGGEEGWRFEERAWQSGNLRPSVQPWSANEGVAIHVCVIVWMQASGP